MLYILKKHVIKLDYIFYVVLLASFIVRVIDLNYNSAFNDEAIYIVVGRMGLFTSDWWSYGANRWMAGLPYIYPTLSALAYQTGGVMGSRFLNVIFGTFIVEEIYRLTRLIAIFDRKTNQIAAIIAAFIAGFSGIGIFVSKLATYDLLSFLLLIVGINSFMKAKYFSNGKYYFLAFICLFLAFLTKIVVAFFFPVLFLMALVILKKRNKRHHNLAIKYFFIPFALGISAYSFIYFGNLMTYIVTHKGLELTYYYSDILKFIWEITGIVIIFTLPSVFVFLYLRKIKEVICLITFAGVIPLSHLILKRYATLDKHLYLTVIFLSVIIGYALAITYSKRKKILSYLSQKQIIANKIFITVFIYLILTTVTSVYIIVSYRQLLALEHEWINTTEVQKYLVQNVKTGDKVLTENGATIALALYNTTFPPKNIVTFDWIDYSGFQDNSGYFQALDDKFFDYIELDNQFEGKGELKDGIRERLNPNYSTVYKKDNIEVYQKNEY